MFIIVMEEIDKKILARIYISRIYIIFIFLAIKKRFTHHEAT